MSIPAIQSAVSQMQSMASQAAGPGAAGAVAQQGDDKKGFVGELQSSIQRINALQQNAAGKAQAFQSGTPGVELNDVMVDMQKSSVAFQMGVQVRNRLVSAYKDIMNMQV